MASNRRYRLLDAFRGIAILWIVAFHLLIDGSEHYGRILHSIIKNGFLGVPIFFVISGYGIAASMEAHDQPPHVFLMRRFKKIYPCYWWSLLFSVLLIPIVHAMLLRFKGQPLNLSWPYTFTDWVQVVTLTKVFSSSSWALYKAFDPYNGPIWYLAIIVQIYLFVTACMYCTKQPRRLRIIFFVFYLASLLTYVPAINHILPYGIFLPYFCQFYIGLTLFYLLKEDISRPQKWLLTAAVVIPLAAVLMFEAPDIELICAAITCLLLVILYRYDHTLENFLGIRILFLFGAFSYSLYMLHVPFRIVGGMMAKSAFPFMGDSAQPIAVAVLAIILSFIWYLFFEKPSNQAAVIRALLSPIDTIRSGFKSVYDNYFKVAAARTARAENLKAPCSR